MQHASPDQRPDGFPGQRLVVVPQPITRRAARAPITRDLCVTHIGSFVAAKGHYVQRSRGAPQHILIACTAGRGECDISGQKWSVGPGDLVFLPPRRRHVYTADPSAPWTILWAHFRGTRAEDYLTALGVTSTNPKVSVDDTSALTDAFEDTFRHTRHGFSEPAMVGMATAFARLLGLARVHHHTPTTRPRETERRLLQVLAGVREDLAHPWTLDEMAREAALSAPHFSELCRRQTGLPPLSLLIRLRLQRAMQLLQQGDHNVAQAGRAVGYEDPFYFSRLFRKHMGVTPKSCRNGP